MVAGFALFRKILVLVDGHVQDLLFGILGLGMRRMVRLRIGMGVGLLMMGLRWLRMGFTMWNWFPCLLLFLLAILSMMLLLMRTY